MKILFLTSSLAAHYGGAAFSESALSSELSKKFEVVVLSRRKRLDKAFIAQQAIQSVKSFAPFSVFLAFLNPRHSISREIRSADVFHLNGHWFWENYFFARLCRRYQVPYILHPRGMLWVSYRKPRLKKLFNFLLGNWIVSHASKIILLSCFEKKHLESYRVREDQIEVIPNGISGVSGDCLSGETEPYFLYLGRIEPRKNLEFLIRAFSIVFQKDKTTRLRLVGPVERRHDRILIQLIESLGLKSAVTLEAPVYNEEKNRTYQKAIAVVYPAFEEPFGRTVFEAFAAGTLCLVPEDSGGAEYVKEFGPGLAYQANSENSLAEKMSQTIGLTKENRTQLVKEAKVWVLENLNWREVTQKVIGVYFDLVPN